MSNQQGIQHWRSCGKRTDAISSFIGIVLVGTKPQWELWIRNSKARISVQYKMPIELPKKEEGQEQMEKYINVNAMLIRAGKY